MKSKINRTYIAKGISILDGLVRYLIEDMQTKLGIGISQEVPKFVFHGSNHTYDHTKFLNSKNLMFIANQASDSSIWLAKGVYSQIEEFFKNNSDRESLLGYSVGHSLTREDKPVLCILYRHKFEKIIPNPSNWKHFAVVNVSNVPELHAKNYLRTVLIDSGIKTPSLAKRSTGIEFTNPLDLCIGEPETISAVDLFKAPALVSESFESTQGEDTNVLNKLLLCRKK